MDLAAALRRACIGFVALILLGSPAAILAQTDEIQVYDAQIEPPGVFNVMDRERYVKHRYYAGLDGEA